MSGSGRAARREIENAVEEAADEFLMELKPGEMPTPHTSWFTYVLILETRRLKWLTVILIILTAILAILTFRLVIGIP
jgi:hypothetical protein